MKTTIYVHILKLINHVFMSSLFFRTCTDYTNRLKPEAKKSNHKFRGKKFARAICLWFTCCQWILFEIFYTHVVTTRHCNCGGSEISFCTPYRLSIWVEDVKQQNYKRMSPHANKWINKQKRKKYDELWFGSTSACTCQLTTRPSDSSTCHAINCKQLDEFCLLELKLRNRPLYLAFI